MFRGITNLNLDSKGRVAMPTRYRDRLAESCQGNLVITVHLDQCLLIYPLPDWEILEQQVMSRPNMNRRVRDLQRLLVGHASDCEMDGNGRILLPAPLREFANLTKRAVLVGQGNKFELWDEDAWNSGRDDWFRQEAREGDLSSILESLTL
ncbi:division/cell wall cluster transcriptional repressor MraZ [Ectothiorhodospira lacustris]|uniref:division/cell wall cluster transcriptional repressor MraZ n=1 Tax=Ectothiorhodospira lacustris TaxID=2899127 RepID=UPI001EE9937B|nr:division/cell wall cluster transcriptional repressor MraZ [Ectothiorhodospira lacustris]MCG5510529.1 division/cell wall cluster transcriptional repressor MraZ [Ectothiorhodospira lacustris]MCG5521221.1 division/cell wall cluster transcriptional repressor MraZ [Ectothiorhodospira lacustris]